MIDCLSDQNIRRFGLRGAPIMKFELFQKSNSNKNSNGVIKTCLKETPYSISGTNCVVFNGEYVWSSANNT
jgi:hypothetical protein